MLIDFLFVNFLLILFNDKLKGRTKHVKAELAGWPQEGFAPVVFSTIGQNKGHMNHSRQCDCHGVTVNFHHWLDEGAVIPTGSNRPQLSFFYHTIKYYNEGSWIFLKSHNLRHKDFRWDDRGDWLNNFFYIGLKNGILLCSTYNMHLNPPVHSWWWTLICSDVASGVLALVSAHKQTHICIHLEWHLGKKVQSSPQGPRGSRVM